jgi:hypothetical protein
VEYRQRHNRVQKKRLGYVRLGSEMDSTEFRKKDKAVKAACYLFVN